MTHRETKIVEWALSHDWAVDCWITNETIFVDTLEFGAISFETVRELREWAGY